MLVKIIFYLSLTIGVIDVATHNSEERPYKFPNNAGTTVMLGLTYLVTNLKRD